MTTPRTLLWIADPRDPVDLAIAARTNSPYTHVGTVIGETVIEQLRGGVRHIPLSEYPANYDLAEFPWADPEGIVRRASEFQPSEGGYDYWAGSSASVRGVLGLKHPFYDDPKRWNCMEQWSKIWNGSRDPLMIPGDVPKFPGFKIVRCVR